ncbi:PREDICTED: uncharacterized protein LOC104811271 [Tarenaya hassleriana]|uniref:uncharacterized protein LOC104811271 n=1 Tax=Tarenaya hassleriana TaxID=28532 RepID=UPI00053C5FD6|nr:PREDICTED: uncharacterized protein LOC104811271 [Tarenaya hassleriana]
MATQFINLAQFRKPETLNATHKILHKNSKPLSFKSVRGNTGSTTHHHDQHIIHHHHHHPDLSVTEHHPFPPSEEGHPTKDRKKKAKKRKSKGGNKYGEWGGEVARITLWWYMKSSIRYILMKARAFYNEFSCDATTYDDESKLAMHFAGGKGTAMMVVDPYFAIPVLPPNI